MSTKLTLRDPQYDRLTLYAFLVSSFVEKPPNMLELRALLLLADKVTPLSPSRRSPTLSVVKVLILAPIATVQSLHNLLYGPESLQDRRRQPETRLA